MPKTLAAALLALLAGLIHLSSASAGFFDVSRPRQACAPFAHDLSVPGLWLGHFTGGRLERTPVSGRVLEWRDQYACFPTRAACDLWQRRLLRDYGSVEGYRTCLPLRGGGIGMKRPIITHVVIAKD